MFATRCVRLLQEYPPPLLCENSNFLPAFFSRPHIIQQELGLRTIRMQGLLRKAGISEIGDIPKSKSCKLCVPYIF